MSSDSREQALIYLTSGAVVTVDHYIARRQAPGGVGVKWERSSAGARMLEYLDMNQVAAIVNVIAERGDAS